MTISDTLSAIAWGATTKLALMRVGATSLVLTCLMIAQAMTSPAATSSDALGLLAMPFVGAIFVSVLLGFGLLAGWLSNIGVPFAGLVSIICCFVCILGDPLIWMLKKYKPEWVPSEQFGFFNPAFIYLYKS